MARLKKHVPGITHHKASGQAVVRLKGKDHYLGPWNSRRAHAKYHRLMSDYLASIESPDDTEGGCFTVAELTDAYLCHAASYYQKNGRPTTETGRIQAMARTVLSLYPELPAEDFRVRHIKAIRRHLLARTPPLARVTINTTIGRVKRMFRWAGENELLDATVYHRLLCVRNLTYGRGGVESKARRPLAWETVAAIQPHISRQVWTMVLLQWHTGMRPGSACIMRTCDVETTGEIWLYRPHDHKTAHLGRELVIALGPAAQRVLRPWLRQDLAAYLFQPREAVAEWNAERRRHRKTPLWPSHAKRKRSRRRHGRPGACYTADSYRRAIARACDEAWPPPEDLARRPNEAKHDFQCRLACKGLLGRLRAWRKAHRWFPHRLRHTFTTRAAHEGIDLEASAAALGHASVDTTQLYRHAQLAKAIEVARKIG